MKTMLRSITLALGIAPIFLKGLTASAAFFSADTAIGVGNTNYDGQDIVIYNCTLTVDGPHSFSDVLLVGTGVLTHTAGTNGLLPNPVHPGSFVNAGLFLNISNDLILEPGTAINADGKGFGGGNGPGAGATALSDIPYGPPFYYSSGGGGGFGGFGGESLSEASGGAAYGMVMGPTNCGSGGGAGAGMGGAGGGAVVLNVGGNIILDGNITANGADGVAESSGGGSGGGIWLTGDSIEGIGAISANGGTGEEFTGGGGGGGRVSIIVVTNTFTGTVIAQGGAGAIGGGAGTIYTISTNMGNATHGQVIVDDGGLQGASSMVDIGAPFDDQRRNLGKFIGGFEQLDSGHGKLRINLEFDIERKCNDPIQRRHFCGWAGI
jgi:hypothetical protein